MHLSTRLLPALFAACLLVSAGCSSSADSSADPSGGSSAAGGSSSAPDGEPATSDPASAPSGADDSTAADVQTETVNAPCPYLEQELVEGIVGQKIDTVQVTTSQPPSGPLPQCEFQRPDGEAAVTTGTVTIAAGTGLDSALELVPGGNPVSAGEGGSVLVHQGQDRTDLAAYAGTTLVSVSINQESSLEATELAKAVLAAIG